MGPQVIPFLMFEGRCEEAMNFYVALFPNSRIVRMLRYGPNEAGKEGSIFQATFSLNGREFRCVDTTIKHAFSFTPSISLFVDFEEEDELDAAYVGLMDGGKALMPLNNYGFSKKFGWVQDKFGVSWQLNLAT